ncbi:electron transport complex subunit RsxC [Thiococcus pfennigii]|uniref:electron transport complex subunit RsxC n=1 Tax=Thiococcus pfennigii TaxID=1057 RepID=UPI00190405AB|nr:electron transport complex subunit RsxC [Thiococcus pfennigii]MBK1699359.1 electron transport complex subunit RsxC [Thiococcus pfennigii]
MKLFKIRGGVHPEDRKGLSSDRPIEPIALPHLLHVPLLQHVGAAANPAVHRGQTVRKGDLLAERQGLISAPVHAPTSGRVVGIGRYPANHPSGLSVPTITLQPDGEDRWSDALVGTDDPFALPPEEIAARVAAAGIVGMGGATFPAAVKLNLRQRYRLHTLVINGSECEPYLTCDDRLMREQSAQVLDGVRIMAHALGVGHIIVAIESNKPEALAAMRTAATGRAEIEIAALPTRYPMGSERHLVFTLTGRESPARGLTADIGVVVHNPATAFAVHEALRHGRPLVERVVTVTGAAIARPANLRVPLGTPVAHLIEQGGGLREAPARLISGGPMMGQPLPSTRVPIVKGSNGVLALTAQEVNRREPMPCIRCGSCVAACPCGLVPLELVARTRAADLEGAVRLGLMDCIGCGSCAYTCPAHIPLVQYINYAKGEMAARGRARHKQIETKRLAELRSARLEAAKRAKREAMARRKRQQQAKAEGETPPLGNAEVGTNAEARP